MFSARIATAFLIGCLSPDNGARPDRVGRQSGVRRAVLDYVEGFYEGDSTKLVEACAPRCSNMASGFRAIRRGIKAGK